MGGMPTQDIVYSQQQLSLLSTPPIYELLDKSIKLVFLLPHQDMALPIPNPIRWPLTHLLANDLKMLESNHAINRAMDDRDPLGAHLLLNLQQLRFRLDMPARRNGLQHEALPREALSITALFELVCR